MKTVKCVLCGQNICKSLFPNHTYEHSEEFYNNVRQLQIKIGTDPMFSFQDVVKGYIKSANLGNLKAIEWLNIQGSSPVKENSIWRKNGIFYPEQVNFREGKPALIRSIKRNSRKGQ